MFDPLGEYLKPRFIGFELIGGKYVQMEMKQSRLRSKVLCLDLVADGDDLRFYDPRAEKWLLTHEEAQMKLQQEILARQIAEAQAQREAQTRQIVEAQAQREIRARQAAEAEVAQLREELARLQKG